MDLRSLMDRAKRQLDVATTAREKDVRKKERTIRINEGAKKKARATAIEHYQAIKREADETRRLKRRTSAREISEMFVREVAPIFQRMMEEHGANLEGTRIIFACSKNDHSGDYHAAILTSPGSKGIYHKATLAEWIRNDQERAQAKIAPEPVTVADDEDDDRLERFASTPNEAGHYPSDDECAAFEAEMVDDE